MNCGPFESLKSDSSGSATKISFQFSNHVESFYGILFGSFWDSLRIFKEDFFKKRLSLRVLSGTSKIIQNELWSILTVEIQFIGFCNHRPHFNLLTMSGTLLGSFRDCLGIFFSRILTKSLVRNISDYLKWLAIHCNCRNLVHRVLQPPIAFQYVDNVRDSFGILLGFFFGIWTKTEQLK